MGALFAVYALLALGLLLCFIGRFPGQVLTYAGMLIAAFATNNHFYPIWLLVVCGVLVIASIIINKTLAPKLAAKVHEFGKAGKMGTIIGSILALITMAAASNGVVALVLLVILPYVVSLLFETISKKNISEGAKRAAGAYILYVTTTFLNIVICAFCIGEVVYGWIS